MLKAGDKVKILHKPYLYHGSGKWCNVDTTGKTGVVRDKLSDYSVYIDGLYSGWYDFGNLQLLARDGVEVGKSYRHSSADWNTKVSHLIFDNDELFVVSRDDDDDEVQLNSFKTFEGYHIVESSDITEVTLEQIAEKMGVSVEKLRIKE